MISNSYLVINFTLNLNLKLCQGKTYLDLVCGEWNGLRQVGKHAVGGGDDVLGGHQSPSTELLSCGSDKSHHPGVLVRLSMGIIRIYHIIIINLQDLLPTHPLSYSSSQSHICKREYLKESFLFLSLKMHKRVIISANNTPCDLNNTESQPSRIAP